MEIAEYYQAKPEEALLELMTGSQGEVPQAYHNWANGGFQSDLYVEPMPAREDHVQAFQQKLDEMQPPATAADAWLRMALLRRLPPYANTSQSPECGLFKRYVNAVEDAPRLSARKLAAAYAYHLPIDRKPELVSPTHLFLQALSTVNASFSKDDMLSAAREVVPSLWTDPPALREQRELDYDPQGVMKREVEPPELFHERACVLRRADLYGKPEIGARSAGVVRMSYDGGLHVHDPTHALDLPEECFDPAFREQVLELSDSCEESSFIYNGKEYENFFGNVSCEGFDFLPFMMEEFRGVQREKHGSGFTLYGVERLPHVLYALHLSYKAGLCCEQALDVPLLDGRTWEIRQICVSAEGNAQPFAAYAKIGRDPYIGNVSAGGSGAPALETV